MSPCVVAPNGGPLVDYVGSVEKLSESGMSKPAGTACCDMIRSSNGIPVPQEVEVLLGAVDPDAASRSATAASLSAAELGVTPL